MAKIIEVVKSTSRLKLDEELAKLPKRKVPIDLEKYFGKINVDGLDYQLSI